MSAHPTSFLDLPLELRHEIYLLHFQSIMIFSKDRSEQHLAIMRTCRQVYHDTAPLAIPNLVVYCHSSAAMIECFVKLGPERITQLRYLIVKHLPMAFQLDPTAKATQSDAVSRFIRRKAAELKDGGNAAPWSDSDHSVASISDTVRYFHIGSLLGLFPGLQLDLLELEWDAEGLGFNGEQNTDCFGTLLDADGYRWLGMDGRMDGLSGDSEPWTELPSVKGWKSSFERGFRPHGGGVTIRLPGCEWKDMDTRNYWLDAKDAGITLARAACDPGAEADGCPGEEEDGCEGEHSYEGEDEPHITMHRGDTADVAVKADDDRVLRCVGTSNLPDGPGYMKGASDGLRKLFRENSWEAIKAMDGYDDCCASIVFGVGTRAYSDWLRSYDASIGDDYSDVSS